MSSPSHPALQQLHHINSSSPNFRDLLSNILYGEEYRQCVPNIAEEDLVWLVDYLDKALNGLDPSSRASRKCLRELRSICGSRTILPTSYMLSGPLPDYKETTEIGHGLPFTPGGSGDVYEGILDEKKVSIKRIRVYSRDKTRSLITLYQEAVVWKRLAHPNIVPLLGITSTPLQLISEWMPGGDLTEYIKKNPDVDRLDLLSDVAHGLDYLHSCNVVHGDLKGPSVLVDNFGHARITDFGLATVTDNPDSVPSGLDDNDHTARWIAPEMLSGQQSHSKEADIFSFAMVMIEVFTGAVPFSNMPAAGAMFAIMAGKRPPRPTHPTFADELWKLMQRCWDQDRLLRPEASEVLGILRGADPPAWKQLISLDLGTQERVSLITSIFSDRDRIEMVKHLRIEDAQVFIDTIEKELDNLDPHIRRVCLRYLRRICSRLAVIPRSLEIEVRYDPQEYPLCNGGFADVWKRPYNGKEVAVKVLRVYRTSNFEQIRRRFCREVMTWKGLRHPNVLPLLGVTMTDNRFVMISDWMENGCITEFVNAHPEADRLELLRDVAKGLIYMHSQGIVHGDLKGANILIDHCGHACLADFSLITVISDRSTFLSSCIEGGTIQWMSPELLAPENFGFRESRPTKESDCYALGMVIYEVLSAQRPYAPHKDFTVIRKVLDGERPRRPQGDEGKLFTDRIWRVVELCWAVEPRQRISAELALRGLGGNPSQSRPPKLDGDGITYIDGNSDVTSNNTSLLTVRSGKLPLPSFPHHATITGSSLLTTHSGSGFSVPLYDYPPGIEEPRVKPDLDAPQNVSPKGGWIARFARNVRKAVAGKLCGL